MPKKRRAKANLKDAKAYYIKHTRNQIKNYASAVWKINEKIAKLENEITSLRHTAATKSALKSMLENSLTLLNRS